jgi:sterol desaturase/sphingolipid hydroxylase (fatty acid hydroxylase superfamily)
MQQLCYDLEMDFFHFKPFVIFGTLIAILALERIFPAVVLREKIERLGRNFSLGILNAIAGPLIVLPITIFAAKWQLAWYPHYVLVDLIILDCCIYFWHRLNHVLPFLWRFHEVHHLDETLDASSALRFHFGEVVLSSCARAVVIFALGVPLTTVAIFEILLTCAAIFHHSNLRLPASLEKMLAGFIVTPSIHWVHHHAIREDTDSNYATVLSIWDRIFGSSSKNLRKLDMTIGVEGVREKSILRLILRPFYKA